MSLCKLKSIIMAAVIIIAAAACKKDDESSIIYVDGKLKFSLPEFISPKATLKMTPSGLIHPDGGEIGYCWKVTPPSKLQFDTTRFWNGLNKKGEISDGSYTYTFPDTLCTFTVYCIGFSEGYSSSSLSLEVTTVSPGINESITDAGFSEADDRKVYVDGVPFYYTTIAGLDWFRQNLWNTETGIPFRNGEPMDGVFGSYYNYEDAMTACPEGWRLPTDKEWSAMAQEVLGVENSDFTHKEIPGIANKLMANARFNGVKLWGYWPEVGKITNESELSVIPTGFVNLGTKTSEGTYPYASFKGDYEYAAFWTADMAEEGMAYYRYIYCKQPELMIGKGDIKTFGASVRCVRENNGYEPK